MRGMRASRTRVEIPFLSRVPQAVVGPLGAGFLWAERADAGPHSLARAPAGGRWSGAETAESSDDDFGSTVGVRRDRGEEVVRERWRCLLVL